MNKIKNYGFSIWYVPYNYLDLKERYNMEHIPHITYKTNIPTIEEALIILNEIKPIIEIEFIDRIVEFPKMYAQDPLHACGYYVKLSSNLYNFDSYNHEYLLNPKLHMSTKYFTDDTINNVTNYLESTTDFITPYKTVCYKAISDNQELDFTKWYLQYQYFE